MQIGINCRSIMKQQRSGIGRYTYSLLSSLGQVDLANTYYLHGPKGLFDFKRSLPQFSYPNFKLCYDFFKSGIGIKTDIYHLPCPDTIPRYQGKLVVTIHDLIARTHPQSHTQETIDLSEQHMRSIARRADHVICISNSTREDFHRFYQYPRAQSSVVYNGVNHELFFPLTKQEMAQATIDRVAMGVEGRYILTVGTLEPRKNLKGILSAMAVLKQAGDYEGRLVVVGMKGWMSEDLGLFIKKLNLESSVKFLGFISDAQLRLLYAGADIFVFPSFYEGFGFPILESMACGTPVVTSNTSSCVEIAASAAITVDPSDVKGIALAMTRILIDKDLAADLRERGIKRAEEFSFEKTAQETLKVYQQVVS